MGSSKTAAGGPDMEDEDRSKGKGKEAEPKIDPKPKPKAKLSAKASAKGGVAKPSAGIDPEPTGRRNQGRAAKSQNTQPAEAKKADNKDNKRKRGG